ncbi:uncharacterized protein QC761_0020700 [Podospora bellae-mahoneyi]|uniref:Uncharacterized protein n=1 Tax=Podospora bellae-mahoneyi TaxID=2093777 RepID=A0ABR0G0X9_9PEZI|nr:hypothetical protein QC761_0020700 [Podospora bellae-mahoneyi]
MQHLVVCFQRRKLLRQHGPVLRQEVPRQDQCVRLVPQEGV